MERTMKKEKTALVVVGSTSILMALVGLWYNSSSLLAHSQDLTEELDTPYFNLAYFTMSAVCIVCYIALFACGVQFIRLRTGHLLFFAALLGFEVVYFFSIGFLWLVPGIGMSVAAATGVANGGLSLQALTLFPLWAPLLAAWAARRMSNANEASSNELETTV
jgi:hypothetical protein